MKDINILVPTDFSESSINAFSAAQELVSIFGGTITPLHAVLDVWMGEGDYPVSYSTEIDYKKVQQEATKNLNDLSAKYIEEKYFKPGLIKIGPASNTILKTAADYDAIVMSSHGRTGFTRIMMGSVAEEVLRFSKSPVLIVKEKSQLSPLKKILVTTDFSDSSFAAFPWALAIAKARGATIELTHVVSLGPYLEAGTSQIAEKYKPYYIEESKSKLNKVISDHFHEMQDRVKSKVITTHVSVHEALYNLIKSNEYDLVVMTSLGHTGLKFLLLGSTTANVVRHASSPVLVIHPT